MKAKNLRIRKKDRALHCPTFVQPKENISKKILTYRSEQQEGKHKNLYLIRTSNIVKITFRNELQAKM